jgi:hypothetical protein
VSNATKKVAMLATQNTGQGEVVASDVGVTAGAASEVEAARRAEGFEGFMFI